MNKVAIKRALDIDNEHMIEGEEMEYVGITNLVKLRNGLTAITQPEKEYPVMPVRKFNQDEILALQEHMKKEGKL